MLAVHAGVRNEFRLDGMHSTDPDEDPLTCTWTVEGGTVEANASEEACRTGMDSDDEAQAVTVELVVSDGELTSEPVSLVLDTAPDNLPPVAVINASVTGRTVTLDGSESHDPDGPTEALRFDWDLVQKPANSSTSMTAEGQTATHTVDVAGTYVFRLMVADTYDVSATETQLIVGD